MATRNFPLQSAIKKILDNPSSRPKISQKSPAKGETSGLLGDADEYGKGSAPDIDMNGSNVVVEVHEALTEGTLDYKIGYVTGSKIDWKKRQKYGEGIQPSVAINNKGNVIEAHEANQTLRYRVGGIDGDKINFSDSHEYDKGERPSIALNNEQIIVEVHKSQNHDELYYHVGNIYGNTIDFSESHKYDSGIRPSVAINDDRLVVEVHQSQNHRTLWYRVGKIEGAKIAWGNDGESIEFDIGKRPSVTLTSDGHVIVANQRSDDLWYRVGRVTGDRINWLGKSVQYNKRGVTPAIACSGSTLVEVHGASVGEELTASVITIPLTGGSPSEPPNFDLGELVAKINSLISQGNDKVSRRALDIGQQEIHLDLGGEGYHEVDGLISGFKTSINLNAQEKDSQPPFRKIPNLVKVDYNKPYPFADGFADYITMQGAPLYEHNVNEIARMLRQGGKVGLWIDEYFAPRIKELESKLNSRAKEVSGNEDEFGGKAGFKKILIEDGR